MNAFDEAGIKLIALSYDEPDALQDFANSHNITYILLSDPNSEIISQFGILNTLIAEDDHPWFGIPFPGTYVVNNKGVITHKFFENNLAVRPGPEQLLRASLGKSFELDGTVLADDNLPTQTEAEVFLDGQHLALTVQRDIVARIKVPNGRHIYANPAPDGMVGVNIELDANPGLVLRTVQQPVSDTHQLANTTEQFQVFHNTVELRLPVTTNSAALGKDKLTISGTLRWQTCDEDVCDVPSRHRFEFTVPLAEPVLPAAVANAPGAVKEPNMPGHFKKMTTRRG